MLYISQGVKNISCNKGKYTMCGVFICVVTFVCVTLLIAIENLDIVITRIGGDLPLSYDTHTISRFITLSSIRSACGLSIRAVLVVTSLVVVYITIITNYEKQHLIGSLISKGMSRQKIFLNCICDVIMFMFMTVAVSAAVAVVLAPLSLARFVPSLTAAQSDLAISSLIPPEVFLYVFVALLVFGLVPIVSFAVYIWKCVPETNKGCQ